VEPRKEEEDYEELGGNILTNITGPLAASSISNVKANQLTRTS
jgi:hypothetical protein